MSASIIKSDLLADSGISQQYNASGQPTYIKIDRVFMVGGIPQTSAAECNAIAIATVQASIPIGTPHPVHTIALAREFRVGNGSQDKLPVIVSYIYSNDGFIDNEWTIECSNYVEQVLTDSEFDSDGILRPIFCTYVNNWFYNDDYPEDPEVYESSACTAQVLRPRKRLVMTRTILSRDDADTLEAASENYTGFVNSATFRGRAAQTWLCMDVSVIFEPFKGINIGRLEFVYQPEGWQPWVRFQNDKLGVPDRIWKYDKDLQSNGMRRANAYPLANFNTLVSLL